MSEQNTKEIHIQDREDIMPAGFHLAFHNSQCVIDRNAGRSNAAQVMTL